MGGLIVVNDDRRVKIADGLVLTSTMQRDVDRCARESGIAEGVLMESAGANAATWIRENCDVHRVAILAGKGGNGGDALVVAWHLLNAGFEVRVCVMAPPAALQDATREKATQLAEVAKTSSGPIQYLSEEPTVVDETLAWADTVVDGLIGNSLDRPLEGRYLDVVKKVNRAALLRIALDLPTGLPSDRGALLGEAMNADITLAMAFLKPAHLLYPARSLCGEVVVVPVAYPESVLSTLSPLAIVPSLLRVQDLLPPRRPDGHKGTFGHVLVAAGSVGMSGAAILCSRGALRAGAGLVTLACPRSLNPIFETALPEVITLPLSDKRGHLRRRNLSRVRTALDRVDAVAVGPGLSRASPVGAFVRALLARIDKPLVLDADGLFHLKGHLDLLRHVEGRAVLTPHPGELAALLGKDVAEIEADRIVIAQAFAREHGVVLVLKGRPTVIGTPEGEVYLNPTGNTGLATGGSGDVLTGLIAGFIATGASPADAALLGPYLHGSTADWLARSRAERTILPSDLLDAFPFAMAEVERCG
jgi:hydroxyethylthiazole kinase-like uncharacterized protein yjeF